MSELHISKYSYISLDSKAVIKVPVTVYKTYCGRDVKVDKIDNYNPTCESCNTWLIWNEIDSSQERLKR